METTLVFVLGSILGLALGAGNLLVTARRGYEQTLQYHAGPVAEDQGLPLAA